MNALRKGKSLLYGNYMEEVSFGCLFRLAGWKVLGHKNRNVSWLLEYVVMDWASDETDSGFGNSVVLLAVDY